MASMVPLNRMVRMVARAFYDDISLEGDNTKSARVDSSGIGVVVLDSLTRRQWVREEDLAKALKIHPKQLRRILQFFEEERLVRRCHRKESPKGVNIYSGGASAVAGDVQPFIEGGEKAKMHTHSYCCLDYAQIYDIVRYRIHHMRKNFKDELDDRDTVQHYVCPNCRRRYSALDALQLVSEMDDYFHCECCKGELFPEIEKPTLEEIGCGGDNTRKHNRDKLKDMQQRMEEQLKPLIALLDRIKHLSFPDFGSLQDWERATIGASANGAVGSSQNSEGLCSWTPMPFLEETEFEVDFSGSTGAQEFVESGMQSIKPLPPWMNRQGTDLMEEQKGENSSSANLDQSSEAKSDKKQCSEEDGSKSIQESYIKAYYEAIQKRQEEKAKSLACISDQPFASDAQFERQLGAKSKRDDDGESGDDDIELKVEQPTGNTGEIYKLADLNVETQQSNDDEYEWQEG